MARLNHRMFSDRTPEVCISPLPDRRESSRAEVALAELARWTGVRHWAIFAPLGGPIEEGREQAHVMTQRIQAGGLRVAKPLYDFINDEALPGTGIAAERFWSALASIIEDLAPRNRALLARRDELQAKIDAWHRERRGRLFDRAAYKSFLSEIGYLVPEGDDFAIEHRACRPRDLEHRRPAAGRAGDQCPLRAERRQCPLGQPLRRPLRHRRDSRSGRCRAGQGLQSGARRAGGRLRARLPGRGVSARRRLARAMPAPIRIEDGRLAGHSQGRRRYRARAAGRASRAIRASPRSPSAVLLVNHGLHVEIRIDRDHPIGRTDAAGVSDVVLEAAVTTIQDCEDSVAAVDAEDKVERLPQLARPDEGRPRRHLREGRQDHRAPPQSGSRPTPAPDGARGDPAGPQPDAGAQRRPPHDHRCGARPATATPCRRACSTRMVTSLIAMHDLRGNGRYRNTPRGLGLHRQAEDARPRRGGVRRRAVRRGSRTRSASTRNTLKMGIMDEERRTTVNLKECIRAAQRPGRVHQHRLPRPHRRRDPHLDGSGSDDPQGRHESGPPGSRPTRTGTSTSASPAVSRAAPRSARACGRCRTRWPTC